MTDPGLLAVRWSRVDAELSVCPKSPIKPNLIATSNRSTPILHGPVVMLGAMTNVQKGAAESAAPPSEYYVCCKSSISLAEVQGWLKLQLAGVASAIQAWADL